MTGKIEKLPSGWYAVFIDGVWIDAACKTIDQAEKILASVTENGVDK